MNRLIVKVGWLFLIAVFLVGMTTSGVLAGQGQVSSMNGVTAYTQSSQEREGSTIDYQNAKPMPMPMVDTPPLGSFEGGASVEDLGIPGFEPGSPGTGKMSLQTWAPGTEGEIIDEADVPIPQEYGASNHPFTTSRVDLKKNDPSKLYPYRAAGKLYFKIGTGSYVCSASLIKKGLFVTAAHCVAAFGKEKFYTAWEYIPALSGSLKPYGTWKVTKAYVKTSYYDGTDPCSTPGIVCENDVAVLVVTPQETTYPGTKTGWFGYGYNGYGFALVPAPINQKAALITQLGYPVSHDSGLMMQRTDSPGLLVSDLVNNTVWGSRQTGGSSGGPELVNFGKAAALSGGVLVGADASFNYVVGVTSWGYIDQAVKQQGASPFLSSNIKSLVTTACTDYPAACAP